MKDVFVRTGCAVALCHALFVSAAAQQLPQPRAANTAPAAMADSSLPPRYVIGIGDVLAVAFWRDQRLSGDVIVRPDGMISLPLLNDVAAAGYTPERLAGALHEAAQKYIADPDVTVIVKEIHSRRVFVLGQVGTPGMIALTGDMNVLQVVAMAGGLTEYADRKNIVIIRTENGQEKRVKFNYNDVLEGKNLRQNIVMQPGDTIVVR